MILFGFIVSMMCNWILELILGNSRFPFDKKVSVVENVDCEYKESESENIKKVKVSIVENVDCE